MKFLQLAIISALTFSTNAYVAPSKHVTKRNGFAVSSRFPQQSPSVISRTGTLQMSFESDFASAMPEKPKQTLSEKLNESATNFIVTLESRLKEGVEAPPELEALRAARDSDDTEDKEMVKLIYELMIEQGMLYDEDAETGKLAPTDFDIPNNLDVPEVKAEFGYLYKYGMGLVQQNMMDVETCKNIVTKRLINRTGLTPTKFDEWLGY